jgi:hypothetical protein
MADGDICAVAIVSTIVTKNILSSKQELERLSFCRVLIHGC